MSKQYGTIDHGDLYLRDCDRNHQTPLKDVSVTPMLHVESDDNSSWQGSQQDEVLDDEEYYITTEPHTPSEAAKEVPIYKGPTGFGRAQTSYPTNIASTTRYNSISTNSGQLEASATRPPR